jgi:hypothetical protein
MRNQTIDALHVQGRQKCPSQEDTEIGDYSRPTSFVDPQCATHAAAELGSREPLQKYGRLSSVVAAAVVVAVVVVVQHRYRDGRC